MTTTWPSPHTEYMTTHDERYRARVRQALADLRNTPRPRTHLDDQPEDYRVNDAENRKRENS